MSSVNTNAQTTQQSPQHKAAQIGHYVFGKTLGEGTFGKVKVATHILTGEKVAIKILEKSKIFDVSDVERVSREIQILKMIRHPHLVQLYEIIETPKQLFLVMEYAVGGELFDYIVQNQRIKDLEAARFFNQIISGIEYIHKLNVVHRDMKPENLLLDTKNRIKIVDFGLSNLYKKDELLKTACGSPCYAAPEMIAGKKYNGLQVDIWSCGVILFAMLCGYLPFEDPNTSALYKKIIQGDYKIPKFVSSEGRDLIKNILNTDPTKRYTIQDIRKHPWFNLFRQSRKSLVPQGLIMGFNRIPVDTILLSGMQAYGFNLEYAQKCIEANRHNHLTTTYYLLLKKHLSSGGKSTGDIGSDKFEPEMLEQMRDQSKTHILVQNQSQQSNHKDAKVESTGGTTAKVNKMDIDRQITSMLNQGDTRLNIQERKIPSFGESTLQKTVPSRDRTYSTQNASLNNTLVANPIENASSMTYKVGKSKMNETEKTSQNTSSILNNNQQYIIPSTNLNVTTYPKQAQDKHSSYRQKRQQNSVNTQINSIMNSPRENQPKNENNSAENTRRTTTTHHQNPFIKNLNNLLNKPQEQQNLFKTTMNRKPNFDTTGTNVEMGAKINNTIYRQNLNLVGETQNNYMQQQFNYIYEGKPKAPIFGSQQRARGITQHEVQSRIQRRLIVGRDSRGKSTEPFDEADNNDLKITSVIDTTTYSNNVQGRTFYKSSRASPSIEPPNTRQYVVPYHSKLHKENPTLMNWSRKD